jgi:GNAT superfamily N-acetyltransferase
LGLTDILFGRKKLKGPASERLFALTTAAVTLNTECDLRFGGAGALVYKPLSAGEFAQAEQDISGLLRAAAREAGSEVESKSDDYGFEWTIVKDRDLEDVVTSVHAAASELQSQGFGERLLAAVFRFARRRDTDRPIYWVYGYKTGTFWPFAPTGQGQERDNAQELELKAKLERELPIEPDLTKWLALFGAPI